MAGNFEFRDDDLARYAEELHATGSTLIPNGVIFGQGEIELLQNLQAQMPEEVVTSGDAGDTHDIHVKRIMVDKAGHPPLMVNLPHSEAILDVLSSAKCEAVIASLFRSGEKFHIRRAQMNRMTKGSFIGIHLDAASNPDYDYSMIIQLGKNFSGGDFLVHASDEQVHAYAARYGSVLVTTCKLRHEVGRVLDGERNSLVYFYARHDGVNRRSDL